MKTPRLATLVGKIICSVKRGHDVPENQIFMANGAYFQGGVCESCDELVQERFLGNFYQHDAEWNDPKWNYVPLRVGSAFSS